MIFKYSKKDFYLVLVCFINIFLLIIAVLYFDKMSLLTKFLSSFLLIGFYCTNYQCVSHNFIHNNFFSSKILNNLFSMINSIAMGLPQTLYYHHHMNHHRYNNDRQNQETGLTKDISSLFRYSKKGDEEEGILSYSFIGFFRLDLIALGKLAKTKEEKIILWLEIFSIISFWIYLIFTDVKYFFLFYIPIWYLGQVVAFMENYFEHYDAIGDSRYNDSVSCYNKLYNFLWFNNGYHQEHHLSAKTHWTKIPNLKIELAEIKNRKIIKGAHFFNISLFKNKDQSH